MTEPLPQRLAQPPPLRRDRPRRRLPLRLRLLAWFIRLTTVAVIFGAGIALGEALHDNPKADGSRTVVRTLRPLPLAPAPVTVTVTRSAH